jgi:hypothetical protein
MSNKVAKANIEGETKVRRSSRTLKAQKDALPVTKKEPAGKAKVFCTCRKGDDGTPMVFCGECNEWLVSFNSHCLENADFLKQVPFQMRRPL